MVSIATDKHPASSGALVPVRKAQPVAVSEQLGFNPDRLQLRNGGTPLPTQRRPIRWGADGITPTVFELTAWTTAAIAAQGDITTELLGAPDLTAPRALSPDMVALLGGGLDLYVDGQDGPSRVRLTERGFGDQAPADDPRAGIVWWKSEVQTRFHKHGSVYCYSRAFVDADVLELDLLWSNYEIAGPCPDLRLTDIRIDLPAGWAYRTVLAYRKGPNDSAATFDPCADGTNTLLQGGTITWRLLIYRTADAAAVAASQWMADGKHMASAHDGAWTWFTIPNALCSYLDGPAARLTAEGGESAMETLAASKWATFYSEYGIAGQTISGPLPPKEPDIDIGEIGQVPWGMYHGDSGYQGGQTGGGGLGWSPDADMVVAGNADAYRWSLGWHTTDQARFTGSPTLNGGPFMPERWRLNEDSDITDLQFFKSPAIDPAPLAKGFATSSSTRFGFNLVPARSATDPEAPFYEDALRKVGSADGSHTQRWLQRRQLMATVWCDPLAAHEIMCNAPWFYIERWAGAATNPTAAAKRYIGLLIDEVAANPNQGISGGRQEILPLLLGAEACANAGPRYDYIREALIEWMGTVLQLIQDCRMSTGLWQRNYNTKDTQNVSPEGTLKANQSAACYTRPLSYGPMAWRSLLNVDDKALEKRPDLATFAADNFSGHEFQQPHRFIPDPAWKNGTAYLHAVDAGPGTPYYTTPAEVPPVNQVGGGWQASPLWTVGYANITMDRFYLRDSFALTLLDAERRGDDAMKKRVAEALLHEAEDSGSFAQWLVNMSANDWSIAQNISAWAEAQADPDATLQAYAAL